MKTETYILEIQKRFGKRAEHISINGLEVLLIPDIKRKMPSLLPLIRSRDYIFLHVNENGSEVPLDNVLRYINTTRAYIRRALDDILKRYLQCEVTNTVPVIIS